MAGPLTECLRDAARRSPYLVIAVALNLTLIGFATIWKLGDERRKAEAIRLTANLSAREAPPPAEPEPVKKPLFNEEDVDVRETDAEPQSNETPLVFPDDVPSEISDRNERDTGDDEFTGLKGSGVDSPFVADGLDFNDRIGVGSDGSGRRGRGGPGNPWAKGRKNTTIGTPRSKTYRQDTAVEAGLRWLARHQNDDGSWSPDGFHSHCQGGSTCEGKGYPEHQVGCTGLALLAFLGAGYDQNSSKAWTDSFTTKAIRVGDVVRRGLKWLRANQDEGGSFSPNNSKWGYNHSIAALAMAEAFGLTRSLPWRESAQKGIDALVAAQNPAPGSTGLLAWRYRPRDGENDISVTGWAVMALKSAELVGLRCPQGSMDGAFNFCEEVTDRASGKVGYTRREEAGQQVKAPGKNDDYANHPALTAVAMCVRTFTRHDADDPMLDAGAKLLVADLPSWSKPKKSNDYYYWYYGSLALNQLDGPESPRAGKSGYWSAWNQAMTKTLLETQTKNEKLCQDGSWDADDRWGFEGGRVYATAINALTFEVYYRYPNVFGARAGGDRKK